MNEIILNTSILPSVDTISYNDNIPADTVVSDHSFAHYNIMLYITKGSLQITEADITYLLHEGDVFFLKESLYYIVSFPKKQRISYYQFCFYMDSDSSTISRTIHISSQSNNIDTEMEINQLYIIPKHIENAIGSVLDKKIHDYYNYFTSENRPFDLEINTSFYDILAECVKLSGEYRQPQTKLSDEIIDYLNEHSNQQLNTTDMEKRFFLTYKYMGTAFKKDTGFTILTYHTNLRMHTARQLLSTTSYSIDEISRILGYTDALYFSRVFKKNNSSSPQDYRKRHRNTHN